MKYVHVLITGSNDDNEKMEVIDDESGSTKTCQSSKSKYPLDVNSATGISTNGGRARGGNGSSARAKK